MYIYVSHKSSNNYKLNIFYGTEKRKTLTDTLILELNNWYNKFYFYVRGIYSRIYREKRNKNNILYETNDTRLIQRLFIDGKTILEVFWFIEQSETNDTCFIYVIN